MSFNLTIVREGKEEEYRQRKEWLYNFIYVPRTTWYNHMVWEAGINIVQAGTPVTETIEYAQEYLATVNEEAITNVGTVRPQAVRLTGR